MGMDGVEIIMEAEAGFDIRIEDAEAEKVLTPGQLIDLVIGKVANVETNFCLSHRAFNRMRTFMVQKLAFPRMEIVPAAKLSQLFPKRRRKNFLREFEVELGIYSAPPLVSPSWLQLLLICLVIFGGLAAAFPVLVRFGTSVGIIAFMLGAFVLGAMAVVFNRHFATEFPTGISTLGDLSLWVKTHKSDLAVKCQKAWSREQVAARVREIVIKTLGCDNNYSEDARFIQDLGLC